MTTWAQLTNAENAPQGVEPVGYSYWSNINNHQGEASLFVFIGRPSALPLLLEVRKSDLAIIRQDEIPRPGTGEGWYFSDTRPFDLYVLEGASLLRYNVITRQTEPVFTLQAGFGSFLWQAHSSDDDRAHSATVRDANYTDVGCVVFREGRQSFFAKRDGYDECQVDKSGRWLVIKEGDGDNRIIDLETGDERTIWNADGAVGHSDCGDGLLVGENDQGARWTAVAWDLADPRQPTIVFEQPGATWGEGMGHISVRGDRALLSTADAIVLIPLDGSGRVLEQLAPFVDLNAPGGCDGYRKRPKANLDPTGQFCCWTANHGSDRLDLFIARITTAPAPRPAPAGGTVRKIATFTQPEHATVRYEPDSGPASDSTLGDKDGRPAAINEFDASVPFSEGAWRTTRADGYAERREHGILRLVEPWGEFLSDVVVLDPQ